MIFIKTEQFSIFNSIFNLEKKYKYINVKEINYIENKEEQYIIYKPKLNILDSLKNLKLNIIVITDFVPFEYINKSKKYNNIKFIIFSKTDEILLKQHNIKYTMATPIPKNLPKEIDGKDLLLLNSLESLNVKDIENINKLSKTYNINFEGIKKIQGKTDFDKMQKIYNIKNINIHSFPLFNIIEEINNCESIFDKSILSFPIVGFIGAYLKKNVILDKLYPGFNNACIDLYKHNNDEIKEIINYNYNFVNQYIKNFKLLENVLDESDN